MDTRFRAPARLSAIAHALDRFGPLKTPSAVAGIAAALIAAAVTAAPAHEFKAGDIEIVHPWSRATPEGAKVAAGYLTLKNDGAEPDRLVSVGGAIAGKSEIHEMSVDQAGVMTMRPVSGGIEIPAGGSVELKPGSFHIMFMELKHGIKQGEEFKGSLTFEKAGTVEVEFAVDAMGGSMGGQGEHDDHGG